MLEDWQGATPAQLAYRRGHSRLAITIQSRSGSDAEMPSDEELRGFELVESMCMRERTRLRLSMAGRPLLATPFVIPALLAARDCEAMVTAAERTAAVRGWQSTRHRHYPTVDTMPFCES